MMNTSVLMMGAVLGSAPARRVPDSERALSALRPRTHARPGR